ncbi:Ig-like domain-containing protein [Neobacillus sp. C211]|uniref:Ig-like domain-containing protein n=1 Tax=unclassified Neobacillus TaxID=2675272 RepID=UPI003979DB4C
MRKLFSILIATIVFLGIVPSYKGAAALATEPQIQVQLVNFLGNQSSISLKIVGSYYLNGNSSNLLISNKSYTVKVENGTLSLYDGNTVLAEGTDVSITPVKGKDHAIINKREYAGSFRFTVEKNQYVRPINTINLEDYVKGVVPFEVYEDWPMEALKAQAVAARTYAYKRLNTTIDDTTSKQVYGGVTSESPNSSIAVETTAGELLTYNGNVIDAVFSASNGGKTENKFNSEISINSSPLSYFKVQTDEYDTTITWNATLHKQQINYTSLDLKNPDSWWDSTNELDADFSKNIKGWMMNHLPGYSNKQIKIVSVPKVTFFEPTESGRFSYGELSLVFFIKDEINPNGELELQTVSTGKNLANILRPIISSKMKSNLFTIDETTDAYSFSGSGYGHGVGLSQYGAYYRGLAGILYKDILSFYYPGTVLSKHYASTPIVNEITDKDTTVTGKAEAGSIVEVKVNGSIIGSEKAGTDGKFTVVIPAQVAGTELAITTTDTAGNVSKITVVVVKDATAPSKPVVNEVTDKDTSVTGKAEAGSKVEVKVNSSVIGAQTVGEDGQYRVTIPVQKAGTELAVISTDKAGNVSEISTVLVKDITAPEMPVVNEITDKDTTVTGEAEAGSKAEIIVNGSVVGSGTAGEDGQYKVTIPSQKAGTEIAVAATDKDGNVSETTKVMVRDVTAPDKPAVNEVTDKDTTVTGQAEAGSKVEVSASGSVIGTEIAEGDGNFEVTISSQKAGTELVIFSMDKSVNISETTEVMVRDVTAPDKPAVNEVTDKDTTVTGQAEAGAKVEVKANGLVIGTGTAGDDGHYEVTIPVQQAGIELVIISTDKAGNVSEETAVLVKDATAPAKPVVSTVSDRDTTLTGVVEAGSKIEVKVNGSVIGTETAGQDGKYKVTIRVQKAGTVLVITASDTAGNQSEGTTIKVIDKTAPTVLTVNTVSDKSKEVTGKTEAGATVSILIGTKIYAAKAHANGSFKVIIPVLKAGTKLIVTAKDAAGNASVAKSNTVIDKTPPVAPTVSTVSDLAKVVTGKAEAGAIVTVTIGTKKYIAKADAKGNYRVMIPVQKAGTKVIVTAKDTAGNVSVAKSVIVIDKTAPLAPKIKTAVKSTTKEVTGTAEAYSTITIKVGKKVIGTANADSKGNFKVKIKAQKTKTVLSVTATDKAKNVSKAVTVKVK